MADLLKLPMLESISDHAHVKDLPRGADAGTMVGVDDRPTDTRIVAIAIRMRTPACRVGDREFSASNLCMHEMCIARKFYDEQSGSLTYEAGWPPQLPRLVPLTQAKLETECNRMYTSYIIPHENSVQYIANDFLGNEPGERLRRLHAQMKKQYTAWKALCEKVRTRVEGASKLSEAVLESVTYNHITEAELREVVEIGDPSKLDDGAFALESIDIEPPVVAKPTSVGMSVDEMKAFVDDESDAKDPVGRFYDGLGELNLSPDQQSNLAALLDDDRKPATLTDDEIVRALGNKSKLKAVRALAAG